MSKQPLDVCILVPIEGDDRLWIDATWRRTETPLQLQIARARLELEDFLGGSLDPLAPDGPRFRSAPLPEPGLRTATAVTLATVLDRGELSWHVIDPGSRPLACWRTRLAALRPSQPPVVGISTTYVTSAKWLQALCALVRQLLPGTKVLVGGAVPATSERDFLALDADVFCLGPAETRLVELASALGAGRPVDHIDGLWLKDDRGHLRSTGELEPLDFDALPLMDWELARRIEPSVDRHRRQAQRRPEMALDESL